ncbi:pseudouridine-5' phosphatase [Lachnospiraceae bacterium TWA4]|nr:pseudouridine-5' phosphatase [Lachnospiraceae bacterium TWA4]
MNEELIKERPLYHTPDFKEKSFKEVEQEYLKLFYSFHLESPKILGVIFDMDGVIIDSEKLYCRFWKEAANALGYPMTHEQALEMRSLNHTLAKEKLQSFFGEHTSHKDIRAKRVELMDAYLENHPMDLKPGVLTILDYLKSNGLKVALATSTKFDRAKSYLSSLQIVDYFEEITSGDMVTNGKPDPEIYLLAAKKLGLSPANCLAVEDSYSGLLSANRAGCYPVMIPDQNEPDEKMNNLLFEKFDRIDKISYLIEKWSENV